MSRRHVALYLSSGLGALTGKNCFSLLERFHRQTRARCPSWALGRGCIMGPGAVRGANLLEGRWRSQGCAAQGFADIAVSFTACTKHTRTLRALLRREMERIRSLDVPDEVRQLLYMAGQSLIDSSDCGFQFMLCEIGKILTFLYRPGLYRRVAQ